jgi:ubiquinone/menaquinone biosynthesis C-methylase UbiE
MAEPSPVLQRLSTLNDVARLRVMRLLAQHELSVGELGRALQLPQSTVSRHLKLLLEGGWIVKRAAGTASLYCLVADALDDGARALWALVRDQLGTSTTDVDDDARLVEVLAERREDSKAFFGRVGGDWDHLRRELFGDHFTAEALLALLDTSWVVADLGCGTGNGADLLAAHVKTVHAIDREPAMLAAARQRLSAHGNVQYHQAELASLPLADGSVDVVTILLVLHHLPEPIVALREAARVLRDPGAVLIVDMVAHDREAYRHTMGHQHLGFAEKTVRNWAKTAGLRTAHYARLRPAIAAKGPGLFAATLRR